MHVTQHISQVDYYKTVLCSIKQADSSTINISRCLKLFSCLPIFKVLYTLFSLGLMNHRNVYFFYNCFFFHFLPFLTAGNTILPVTDQWKPVLSVQPVRNCKPSVTPNPFSDATINYSNSLILASSICSKDHMWNLSLFFFCWDFPSFSEGKNLGWQRELKLCSWVNPCNTYGWN